MSRDDLETLMVEAVDALLMRTRAPRRKSSVFSGA